jgi:MoaA/NifB/PqqE/SkfB family radical SAM enzyme
VVVTGGEPLLRRDLFTVVSRCRELGLFLSLTTNGTRLASVPDESLRLFDHITVSIDSIDPAEYAVRRGSQGLDDAIGGLLHARRCCPEAVIHAQTVVDAENWQRIPAVNRFFHRHGIDTVFQLIDGERVPFDDRVWTRTVSQLQFHSKSLAALSRRFLRLFPAVSRSSARVPCLALTASFVLSAPGQMLPCSFRRDPVADLRGEAFTAAWRRLGHARRAMLSDERGCDCGSTCFVMPALALRLRAGRALPA